jgi:hypothetical protein
MGGGLMADIKYGDSLYELFLKFDYSELEELASKAQDQDERNFYARLCNLYLAQNQPRIMREKPF